MLPGQYRPTGKNSKAGIKGVLNFAPICLKAPQGCVVNNINLETELENLIYFINAADEGN